MDDGPLRKALKEKSRLSVEVQRLRAVRDHANQLLLELMLPMDTRETQNKLKSLIAETWSVK